MSRENREAAESDEAQEVSGVILNIPASETGSSVQVGVLAGHNRNGEPKLAVGKLTGLRTLRPRSRTPAGRGERTAEGRYSHCRRLPGPQERWKRWADPCQRYC